MLGKCTCCLTKAKEVTPHLMAELPEMLPVIAEVVGAHGVKAAFQNERVIGQMEVDRYLIPSIREAYETLSLNDPVEDPAKPPPPGWAAVQAQEKTAGKDESKMQRVEQPKDVEPAGADPSMKHLSWMRRLDEKEVDLSVFDADAIADYASTAHRWMVLQGVEFSSIAEDMKGFWKTFCKSVCSSLGLPAHGNCVEVLSVTYGSSTAIVIEFALRRPERGTDSRHAPALAQLLEAQLLSQYSALRRGPLSHLLSNGVLLASAPQPQRDNEVVAAAVGAPSSPVAAAPSPEAGRPAAATTEASTQTDTHEMGTPRANHVRGASAYGACSPQEEQDFVLQIREAVRQLKSARQRQLTAAAGEKKAAEEIRKKDELLAKLREELA